jgi:ketosteroid isomerase-like protein
MPPPALNEPAVLIRISHEILDAIREKNPLGLAHYLAEDFVHRTEKGVLTRRSEFLAAIAAAPFGIEMLTFESIVVDVFGAVALVSGVQSGQVRLQDGQLVQTRSAFTDLFLRSAASWCLQAATSADL